MNASLICRKGEDAVEPLDVLIDDDVRDALAPEQSTRHLDHGGVIGEDRRYGAADPGARNFI